MKLILIRHGKTIENEQGIFQGQRHGTLSKLGIEQSKELALKLKNEKIDFIYSSDLARCVDTTKEITKFHTNTPIKLIKELRERDFGEFTGVKKGDLGIDPKALVGDILDTQEGEQIEQVRARVEKIFKKIQQEHKEDTILIVGHNAINKILLSLILNKPLNKIKPQNNLEVNILNI